MKYIKFKNLIRSLIIFINIPVGIIHIHIIVLFIDVVIASIIVISPVQLSFAGCSAFLRILPLLVVYDSMLFVNMFIERILLL